MERKRLFFVGIPKWKVLASFDRMKKLGFEILLGDTRKNISKKAGEISDVDRFVTTDYKNYKDLFSVAKALHGEKPLDAVFTYKEDGQVNVARIAHEFGLKGNSPEAVEKCIDKYRSRQLLRNAGLPSPAFSLCRNLEELEEFFKSVESSIVIKPNNLQGSIGVFKIDENRRLKSVYQKCRRQCVDDLILAEEFIDGQEVSLEAMVYYGKVILFGVTEKSLYPNTFIESGHRSPYSGGKLSQKDYIKLIRQIVSAVGITIGPLHIEGFHTRKGFVVGEVHPRYGGDNIPLITELAQDCDMISPIFAELGDIPYTIDPGKQRERAEIRFLNVPPGKVVGVEGIEDIRSMKHVVDIQVNCRPGDTVHPLRSSFDRVGWILVKAPEDSIIRETLSDAFKRLNISTILHSGK